jgi:protein TonB
MNRNLIIGILASLGFHGGLVVYSECFCGGQSAGLAAPSAPIYAAIAMPKIEPDKPDEDETVYNDREQSMQQPLAPPTQDEVFQIVLDTSFVQPMQPPKPARMPAGQIVISMPPTQRSTGGRFEGFGVVYEIEKVDEIPEVVVQVPPDYPYQLRSAGITGEVTVDCVVDSKGDVRHPLADRTARPEFGAAAERAVGMWKFRPGQRKGQAVNTHVLVPIIFSINKSPFTAHH